MNCLSQNTLSQSISQAMRTQLKADYNLSLSTYDDENAETPTCVHNYTGSMKHPVATLLAFVGIAVTFCAVLHGLCCLISKLCES